MISSVLGVAVVALPAGIVTAGYMKALERAEEEEREAKARRASDLKISEDDVNINEELEYNGGGGK